MVADTPPLPLCEPAPCLAPCCLLGAPTRLHPHLTMVYGVDCHNTTLLNPRSTHGYVQHTSWASLNKLLKNKSCPLMPSAHQIHLVKTHRRLLLMVAPQLWTPSPLQPVRTWAWASSGGIVRLFIWAGFEQEELCVWTLFGDFVYYTQLYFEVLSAFSSGVQPSCPTGQMSDTGPVHKLDQALGPSTTPFLPHTLALDPESLMLPPSTPTCQDWDPGAWYSSLLAPLHQDWALEPSVTQAISVHRDWALNPECRAQGFPWVWKFGSMVVVSPPSCCQISRAMCSPVGQIT